MVVSLVAGLGLGARADAQILAPVSRAFNAIVAQLAPSPAPSASLPPVAPPTAAPTPTPTPKPKLIGRGGPLQFNLAGSLSLGESSTASTFGQTGFITPSPGPTGSPSGPFPFQQAETTNQNISDIGAGLSALLERRTVATNVTLRVPFGASSRGRGLFGVPQFLYSTPKYSVGYGAQPLLALAQLQLGSTLRGFEFITPVRNGQITLFQGPATGANAEDVNLVGGLLQRSAGRALYEAGAVYGYGGNSTGRVLAIDFGGAIAAKTLSLIGEGAWETRRGGDGASHGIAAQIRLDDAGSKGECAISVRSVPDQFISFIAGEIYSDRYGDLNCHSAHTPLTFDANYEKTGDALFGINEQKVETLSYSPSLRFGGVAFSATRQDGSSAGEKVSTSQGSVEFQTQLWKTTALLGEQLQNSTQGDERDVTSSILASLHRPITRTLSVGISGEMERNLSVVPFSVDGASPAPGAPDVASLNRTKSIAFSIAQAWKKTSIQFTDTITRTLAQTADSLQQTPLVTLTRQISPVIAISTSLGEQRLRDRLNPAVDGHTRVFSLSLSAPFSYGNANVTGRVDPRLPATITGRVLYASSNTGSGALANLSTFTGNGGVGNILVTLDNKYVQRTDLTGSFQFAFLTPGQHQLTIDTSSMPRGYTAAIPVQTITVQGGQQATVVFSIGTFGGIEGHVYGSDTNGNPEPLANVQLRVDNGTYSQTDSTGAYGFGGLSSGEHELTIVPQSIPATADFSTEALQQKVTVSNGSYTTADFHAEILGSISGRILYAKDMEEVADTGVLNAYVVAEPGEHAAIDEDSGDFIIDNLPAGDYSVSVDPETIRSDLGAAPQSVTVHLGPGERYSGLIFTVGRFEKKVVFTLLSGGGSSTAAAPAQVHLSESRLPARGTTTVSITAGQDAKDVHVEAFGKATALTYDKSLARWVGQIAVPAKQTAGAAPVRAFVNGAALSETTTITVDPKIPLVTVQIVSGRAVTGQTVLVRARFLTDVHAGDEIAWDDGTTTKLGKPVSGRVFTFEKRLTLLPLHGTLLTSQGPVPIELL